ncbi:tRNA(Met) cytidine acetyltransferase TmcA [Arsenophonus apicola]|uniref:tRNA(Met) cytidine acetyltransferase TmcA n=1 Tax=Arsenophonus apicola TaxID=2879119 RepID=A0ABY8P723_9GAMM|nr:GNAT family N-acetyltransferase [Arsenophonus apicola]WGO84746.1 GNAT family N-acetyltransferase [Arsenophonus apicola]
MTIASLINLQLQLCIQGQRRLLVLSGQSNWILTQLIALKQGMVGDWQTISPHWSDAIPPQKAASLLGQEFLHGVFDATKGFHTEALLMLAGTLKAGSYLIICLPEWTIWSQQLDQDSQRWNEVASIIAVPNFVSWLKYHLQHDANVLLWCEGKSFTAHALPQIAAWHQPNGQPTIEQEKILQHLLTGEAGIWALVAPRGRGKSALAGMLIERWQGKCWVCVPAKSASTVLTHYTNKKIRYWSVDNLLATCQLQKPLEIDWLIIDEAAMIPIAQLNQLTHYFPRLLFTTTVDGYEGTGRGFLLKLCTQFTQCHIITLTTPIRWASNDPLENWLNNSLLLKENLPKPSTITKLNNHDIALLPISQSLLIEKPQLLSAIYGLLTNAHYRTSPLDLRRLLDAQGMTLLVAQQKKHLLAVLWLVNEGGLSASLAHEVWAGRRRPKGNLVAQSLAAHSYFPQAAQMNSQRISRIAVTAAFRRQGVATKLLTFCQQQAIKEGKDFLSVSFGYCEQLQVLWQQNGFHLVRIGSRKEATSGFYTAMAILPLSSKAKLWVSRAHYLLKRDAFYINQLTGLTLAAIKDDQLNDEDWQVLAGFAHGNRSFSVSYPSIRRLLMQSTLALTATRIHCEHNLPIKVCCQQLKLTGQKMWLKQVRNDIADALSELDSQRAEKLKLWVNASFD